MKIFYHVAIILFFFISSCRAPENQNLVIATSANMQFTIDELIKSFSQTNNIKCELVISSSGKITSQILEGAHFDIFLSADMTYPEVLFKKGFTTGPPEIYAFGKLVLWTIKEEIEPSIDLLTQEDINHIAMANPKLAPYGIAAYETLTHFDILPEVERKLVYGESIAQTNQFIISGAAEIGFTAKSVVLSKPVRKLGRWKDVDQEAYKPIAQGVVIMKNKNGKQESAQMFHDFLFSQEGKKILNKFGYSVN